MNTSYDPKGFKLGGIGSLRVVVKLYSIQENHVFVLTVLKANLNKVTQVPWLK